MDNSEIAQSKIERAYFLYENFDCMSEQDMKNILFNLLQALELMPTDDPDKYEVYGYVRNLAARNIERFGAIFKAVNWKDSVIIKKEDVRDMIKQTNDLLY